MQHPSIDRRRTSVSSGLRRGAVSACVAVAVLAGSAIPASAAPGDPVVSFIDMGGYPQTTAQLNSSNLDGTLSTRTSLASSVNTQAFAVSDDGNTLAVTGWAGGYSADNSDVTFGTLVTRRTGSATETRILSSQYTANPVVSPDGLSVWFLNYISAPGGASSTLALYKYNVTSKVTTRLSLSSAFQPAAASGPETLRLAISPDGSKAAIVYRAFDANGDAANPSRIFAAGISAGKTGNYFEQKDIASSSEIASTASLAWAEDNSTLTFTKEDLASGQLSTYSVAVTAPNAQASAGPLTDWYDVARYNGEWWMWQDDASNPASSFGHSADPSPVVAPSTTTAWVGDFYVRSFRLSAVTPPAIGTPVNRPVAHPGLILNATSVGYKKSTAYYSYNDYMVPLAGQIFNDNYSETERGLLQKSTDGKAYSTLLTTTAAHPVTAGGYTWTANTPAATRTLYYRWCFQATTFAAAGCSTATKVTMIPTVTATVTKSGTKRKIVGTATRVGGSVTLYKVVGSKATKIATKTINSAGVYSFGTLSLKTGNYRISTVADSYAGVGSKTFKV